MKTEGLVLGLGFRVSGLGFRVWGFRFRVLGLRQGEGFSEGLGLGIGLRSFDWTVSEFQGLRALRLRVQGSRLLVLLTGPKPKEIKVETFRIDYPIRGPKVEKLSLQPMRLRVSSTLG